MNASLPALVSRVMDAAGPLAAQIVIFGPPEDVLADFLHGDAIHVIIRSVHHMDMQFVRCASLKRFINNHST